MSGARRRRPRGERARGPGAASGGFSTRSRGSKRVPRCVSIRRRGTGPRPSLWRCLPALLTSSWTSSITTTSTPSWPGDPTGEVSRKAEALALRLPGTAGSVGWVGRGGRRGKRLRAELARVKLSEEGGKLDSHDQWPFNISRRTSIQSSTSRKDKASSLGTPPCALKRKGSSKPARLCCIIHI